MALSAKNALRSRATACPHAFSTSQRRSVAVAAPVVRSFGGLGRAELGLPALIRRQLPPRVQAGATTARQQSSLRCKAAAAEPAAPPSSSTSMDELTTLTTWLFKPGAKGAKNARKRRVQKEAENKIDTELCVVLSSIATACKQISSLVSRSGISGMTGLAGAANIQGEDQKKLDVISNDVFCNVLRSSGRTGTIASEEEDLPVAVEETYSGNYVVVFDPLDGSSNIDAGISVGSIFGVYEPSDQCNIDDMDNPDTMMQNCVLNVCQPGNRLQCAGYVLYSSSTMLVLTTGEGVCGFTLDSQIGEFVLTHPDIRVPETGKIYSFNEGNYGLWDEGTRKYMDSLKEADKWDGKPYSARYIGSLVGDFHRTILYGGIYGYPGDSKNPNGKLRLLYECAPMSFIAEQAGGKGSTGQMRVLDVDPEQVHQRVPLFVGSTKEVEYYESFVKKE